MQNPHCSLDLRADTPKKAPRRYGFWLIPLAFLLAACLPEGVRLPESELLRHFERTSGLIAYLGVDGNVYTIDQAGKNQIAVTEDARFPGGGQFQIYQHLTWAPDSRRLGFVGATGSDAGVEEMSILVTGQEAQGVTEAFASNQEAPFYLYWAPDGEQIGFLASSGTSSDLLFEVISITTGDTQVVDTGAPYYWHWGPDSDQMVIHAGGTAGNRMGILTLGGQISERRFRHMPTLFKAPAWSPDGTELLLAVQDEQFARSLVLARNDGSIKQELVNFDTSVAFAWSPDGNHIAYLVNSDLVPSAMFGKLHVVDPDNPGAVMTSEEEFVEAFFWSPNGQQVAYFTPVVFQTESDTGASEDVVFQGLHILDIATGESRRITAFRPTGEFLQLFPFFDQYHHSMTIWSPDSEYLVFAGVDGSGESGIWVVSAAGQRDPRFIAPGLVGYWSRQ
jgi:TolB protein